jgi:DNA-binding winged helix-turn-helix (wHTH) protein
MSVEPKAFRVLLILLRNPQKLITKEELLNAVWGDAAVTENSLARSIALLRRLLADDTHNPRYIETVATVGYRFLCPVEVSEDSSGNIEEVGKPTGQVQVFPVNPLTQVDKGAAGRPKTIGAKKLLRYGIAVTAVAVLFLIGLAIWYSHPRRLTVTNIVRLTNDPRAKIPINGVVTDGVHLYFMEGIPWGSGSGIAQVAAVGGETTWIATTLQDARAILDISADKSKLLIARRGPNLKSGNEFWIQPLPAGSPYRLGNLLADSSMSWTPDGAHIIYCDQLQPLHQEPADHRPPTRRIHPEQHYERQPYGYSARPD